MNIFKSKLRKRIERKVIELVRLRAKLESLRYDCINSQNKAGELLIIQYIRNNENETELLKSRS